MRRNTKANPQTTEADLHQHLNDQVAQKKKNQLEELINDKQSFVKYYAENGNDEAREIVAEQVRRLEKELADLGGPTRPTAILTTEAPHAAPNGNLPARFEPLKAEKKNALFGASSAAPPWAQAVHANPSATSNAPTLANKPAPVADAKSTRDAVWEQKRQQFLNKQKQARSASPAPAGHAPSSFVAPEPANPAPRQFEAPSPAFNSAPVANEMDILHAMGDAKFGKPRSRRAPPSIQADVSSAAGEGGATASNGFQRQVGIAAAGHNGGSQARVGLGGHERQVTSLEVAGVGCIDDKEPCLNGPMLDGAGGRDVFSSQDMVNHSSPVRPPKMQEQELAAEGILALGQDNLAKQQHLKRQQQEEYRAFLAQQQSDEQRPRSGNERAETLQQHNGASLNLGSRPMDTRANRQNYAEELRQQMMDANHQRESNRQRELPSSPLQVNDGPHDVGGINGLGADRVAREQKLRQQLQLDYRAHLQQQQSRPNSGNQAQMNGVSCFAREQQGREQQPPSSAAGHSVAPDAAAPVRDGIMRIGEDRASREQQMRKQQQDDYRQYLASQQQQAQQKTNTQERHMIAPDGAPAIAAAPLAFAGAQPTRGAQRNASQESKLAYGEELRRQMEQQQRQTPLGQQSDRGSQQQFGQNMIQQQQEFGLNIQQQQQTSQFGMPVAGTHHNQTNQSGSRHTERTPAPWEIVEQRPTTKLSYAEDLKRQMLEAKAQKEKRKQQLDAKEWWERSDVPSERPEPPRRGRKIVQEDNAEVKKVLQQQIEEKRRAKEREKQLKFEEELRDIESESHPPQSERRQMPRPPPAFSSIHDQHGQTTSSRAVPSTSQQDASLVRPDPFSAGECTTASIQPPAGHQQVMFSPRSYALSSLPPAVSNIAQPHAQGPGHGVRRDEMLNVLLQQHNTAQEMAQAQQKQLLAQLQEANSQLQAQMERLRSEKEDAVMDIVKLKERHLDEKSKEVALLQEQLKRKILFDGFMDPASAGPLWSKYEPARDDFPTLRTNAPSQYITPPPARPSSDPTPFMEPHSRQGIFTAPNPTTATAASAIPAYVAPPFPAQQYRSPGDPLEQSLASESKLISLLNNDTWKADSLKQALRMSPPRARAGQRQPSMPTVAELMHSAITPPRSAAPTTQPAPLPSEFSSFDPDRALADFNAHASKADAAHFSEQNQGASSAYCEEKADLNRVQRLDELLGQSELITSTGTKTLSRENSPKRLNPNVSTASAEGTHQKKLEAAVKALREIRGTAKKPKELCGESDSSPDISVNCHPPAYERSVFDGLHSAPTSASMPTNVVSSNSNVLSYSRGFPPSPTSPHARDSSHWELSLADPTSPLGSVLHKARVRASVEKAGGMNNSGEKGVDAITALERVLANMSAASPTPVRNSDMLPEATTGVRASGSPPGSPLAQMLASMKATASSATLQADDVLLTRSFNDHNDAEVSPGSPLERMIATLKSQGEQTMNGEAVTQENATFMVHNPKETLPPNGPLTTRHLEASSTSVQPLDFVRESLPLLPLSPLGRMLQTIPPQDRNFGSDNTESKSLLAAPRSASPPAHVQPAVAPLSPLGRMLETLDPPAGAPKLPLDDNPPTCDSLSYSITGTLASPLSRWARSEQLDDLNLSGIQPLHVGYDVNTTTNDGTTAPASPQPPSAAAAAPPDLPSLQRALLQANDMNSNLRDELLQLCNPSLAELHRKKVGTHI